MFVTCQKYIRDPVYPKATESGKKIHKRKLYDEIIAVLKEAHNPEGLTAREIGSKLSKPATDISPLLWSLKHGHAVLNTREGFYRT